MLTGRSSQTAVMRSLPLPAASPAFVNGPEESGLKLYAIRFSGYTAWATGQESALKNELR